MRVPVHSKPFKLLSSNTIILILRDYTELM